MFLFLGTSCDEKVIREFPNLVCPVCGRYSRASLVFVFQYFHLFFIPIFKFNKHYFVRFRCCGAEYEATPEQFEAIKNGADPDVSNMRRTDTFGMGAARRCPCCGREVEAGYSFCPYCGTKMQ